ncbi:MAG: AarF/ABC1/UbiB kinase family protein [Bacillota bacterium]|nr:AarF/ABC1/UbiB kinase family protein [Bacillota bacterium]
MIATARRTRGILYHYRHWRRYQEILNVLVKYGFSYVIDTLNLPGLPLYRRLKKRFLAREGELETVPGRIVKAIQELGPTFVKLGQLLSTRADLIPEPFLKEFIKLQDRVTPIPFHEVEALFLKEHQKPVSEIFRLFEPEPVASASIGQAHRAVFLDGREVVVKIQRPGIDRIIGVDLEILLEIGSIIEQRTAIGEVYKIGEILDEFSISLREELDFTLEGRNAEVLRENLSDDPRVYIPKVYWEYTTRRILIMEYVQGQKITTPAELQAAGYDPLYLARTLADTMIRQIYVDGFFHSDPHPGNLAVLPGNRIVFMDFGQVGRMDEELREKAADLVLALVRHDLDGIIKSLLRIGILRGQPNLSRLKHDLSRLERKYYGLPFREIHVGTSVRELMELAWRYQIQVPSDFVMAAKALVTLEGVIRELAPEMSLVEIAEPFAWRVSWRRYDPRRLQRRFWQRLAETSGSVTRLPGLAEEAARKIIHGQVSFEIQHREFPLAVGHLQRAVNRLALSIILASLLIAGSLLTRLDSYSFLVRFHLSELVLGLAFIASFFLIAFLLFFSRS